MTMTQDDRRLDGITRTSGVAAIVGGGLAIVAATLLALQPEGCIGVECELRPMRGTPIGIAAIGVVATVLIVVGVAGLTRLATRSGSGARLARAVRLCGGSGLAVLFAGSLAQEVFFDGDLFLMPVVVAIGGLLILAALALLVALVVRTGALPPWLAISLGVGSVLLAGMNDQSAAILFVIPFALAVAAIGAVMALRTPARAV